MNIYTYFVPVRLIDQSTQRRVLNWWQQSWRKSGWNPVILTQSDAAKHPYFQEYRSAMMKKPMMNSPEYELACFYRWLATASSGGGVQADYDCINNGLRPEDLDAFLKDGKLTLYEPAHVPSLLSGSKEEYERMARTFAAFDLSQYKEHMMKESRNGTAISDMFIIANDPSVIRPQKIVWEFHREPGWQTAKAIHFSHWACEGIGKENAIPRWMASR